MAYRINFSPVALLFIFNILLATTGQAVAGREIPTESKNVDIKQPEWLIKSDHSFVIPGIGRVMLPPLHGGLPYAPYAPYPGNGGSGSSSGYIPGGDDTFVPNPGVEVPNPAGRGVPAPVHP